MLAYELPYATRSGIHQPHSLGERILKALPPQISYRVQALLQSHRYQSIPTELAPTLLKKLRSTRQCLTVRSVFRLAHALIAIWLVLMLWGERWVFTNAVKACEWKSWERWPKEATPHRMVLLTDPQLVDPHTYPGRPWPLSRLTEKHTDNYMRRSFIRIDQELYPDTLIFLGDMFDGGREWTTGEGSTDDPPWATPKRREDEMLLAKVWKKKYGTDYWLKEYARFDSIFYQHWNLDHENEEIGGTSHTRKIITGLPGNHDFGFGTNVRLGARDRFQAYFGESNRIDVIGNHTFVSIDGLSLSGKDPSIPETATIWKPVDDFLAQVPDMKQRALASELRAQARSADSTHARVVVDVDPHGLVAGPLVNKDSTAATGGGTTKLPTVLLTHVPLYRDPGTPCGPMRERSPPQMRPVGQSEPVSPDEPNSIPINGGYQYQNVLSDTVSHDILKRVEDVVHVFSGDDHDYCELTHPIARGGVKEITVKSMSWAMGVRRPGFLLVSLWNPIDAGGQSIGIRGTGDGAASASSYPTTIETHLCLLPDQLNIFLSYLSMLLMTLAILLTAALLRSTSLTKHLFLFTRFSNMTANPPTRRDSIALPKFAFTRENPSHLYNSEKRYSSVSESSTSSSSSGGNANSLAPRSNAQRARSVSPVPSYGTGNEALMETNSGLTTSTEEGLLAAPAERASFPPNDVYTPSAMGKRDDDYDQEADGWNTQKSSWARGVLDDFVGSVWRVAWVVMLWYLWLCYSG